MAPDNKQAELEKRQKEELDKLKQMWKKGKLDNADWKGFPFCDFDCGNKKGCIYLPINGTVVCKKCLVKCFEPELGKSCDDCRCISKDTRIIPLNTNGDLVYKRLCRDCIMLENLK
jgi:hypothetical protein